MRSCCWFRQQVNSCVTAMEVNLQILALLFLLLTHTQVIPTILFCFLTAILFCFLTAILFCGPAIKYICLLAAILSFVRPLYFSGRHFVLLSGRQIYLFTGHHFVLWSGRHFFFWPLFFWPLFFWPPFCLVFWPLFGSVFWPPFWLVFWSPFSLVLWLPFCLVLRPKFCLVVRPLFCCCPATTTVYYIFLCPPFCYIFRIHHLFHALILFCFQCAFCLWLMPIILLKFTLLSPFFMFYFFYPRLLKNLTMPWEAVKWAALKVQKNKSLPEYQNVMYILSGLFGDISWHTFPNV